MTFRLTLAAFGLCIPAVAATNGGSQVTFNKDVAPFNYRLMSKVLHPDDWDPQDLLTPLDIDVEWGGIAKPDNFKYPAEYLAAKKSGEMDSVAAEYKAHYKIDMFGPSPNKKA